MELKLLIRMLWKRVWFLLLTVVICTTAAGVYSIYGMKPAYEASSTLIVNKSNLDAEGKPSLDINEINSNIMLINSYKEILSSGKIMDQVVIKHAELKVSAQDLRDRLKVITTQNSQIITLTIRDNSYAQAMNIVNAVAQVFKEEIPKIMKIDNISILDTAQPQTDPAPVSPLIKLNIVIAFVASLLIAVGIVLLKEYLDDTIKTDYDVERYLDMPTLGTVGRMSKRDLRSRARVKAKSKVGEQQYATISQ
ncbi:YveK family protein [Paenibacillus guangzhouensis]|uniref:YveK family protein n=1 Tax=Paenibacillus guangzhouensis TaxID=1473112 RepID=UPI0012675AB0|nr:Wzz/FepE/Etk N-terminal domain-containing protein [Paenibacillus guangzhouensis]